MFVRVLLPKLWILTVIEFFPAELMATFRVLAALQFNHFVPHNVHILSRLVKIQKLFRMALIDQDNFGLFVYIVFWSCPAFAWFYPTLYLFSSMFLFQEWHVLSFIRSLRSMTRSSNAVVILSFPPSLLSPSFSKRLQHMADTLLSVRAIPGLSYALASPLLLVLM